MKMKYFLVTKVISYILILSVILSSSSIMALASNVGNESNVTAAEESFERQTINFNREWKFIREDTASTMGISLAGAEQSDYDDSKWYNIGLPHDFNMPYWQEEVHYTGVGWYRKNLEIGSEWDGKRINLDFEGAFHTIELFVNGVSVGTHRGGYTGFTFDITDYVNVGNNVIAASVSNKWDATLAPRAGEHMFTGGIYRDVNLVITSPVHVAWYGTFVQTPDISKDSSKVRMQVEVENDSKDAKSVNVVSTVYDSDKQEIKKIESSPQTIQAGEVYNFDNTSESIDNPKLWSPDTPNLYNIVTEVFVNGQPVDQYETKFGFRWVEWTADQGFFLNGEHLWINGTNAHQDQAGWANAVTQDGLKRDVELIKETGMNFIRGSHYPHATSYAKACDETGILFWSEAAFWCTAAYGEGGGKNNSNDYKADGYPTTGNAQTEAAFEQSCLDNVYEMIRTNRNHPSIVVWSMGNEAFFGSNHAKKKALISKMAAYAKELDPTRATAMGGTQRSGFDKIENIDVTGYNGDGASIAEYQDPGIANMVAEYGSHTGNRPDNYKAYFGNVKVGADGKPIEYSWRAGVALWCAFHHGSIMARSYGDMGFIDYYRLPLNTWYYYRNLYTGVARESSVSGTPTKLGIQASDLEITNNGTQDSQIIVTVQDVQGKWLNSTPKVKLEVVDGPGVFPTGKIMEFEPGTNMLDGRAAISFRSHYAGTTTIRATADGLESAEIVITTIGEGGEEPAISTMYGSFMKGSSKPEEPVSIEDPTSYSYHSYLGSPVNASSNSNDAINVLDGNHDTGWIAEEAGSGQWIYFEAEHGGISLYKAKLAFNGKVYPYRIQYKELNIDEDEWKTLVEYDENSVITRPLEETFYGTYMRYFRVEFLNVPDGEYANLAEIELYGIRSMLKGYSTGSVYLSDLNGTTTTEINLDASSDGNAITAGGVKYHKGIGVQGSAEIVYNLEELEGKYARFVCIAGADLEVEGTPDMKIQGYCDGALMFTSDIKSSSDVLNIDISVNDVKELKLVVTANSNSDSNKLNWADAKLIGAIRDASLGDDISVQYISNTDTLVQGRDFNITTTLENKADINKNLAASLTLYTKDGEVLASKASSLSLNNSDKEKMNIVLNIPTDIEIADYAKFIIWDADTLVPISEEIVTSRVVGDPEKDKYQAKLDYDIFLPVGIVKGSWVDVLGDSLNKSTSWGKWTTKKAKSGYETYVGADGYAWNNSWIEETFVGTQVKIYAKIDGSQKGANVYIDGQKVKTISTNGSPDSYSEVFDSGKLGKTNTEHKIRIEPTGKFGIDYVQYYALEEENVNADKGELSATIEQYVSIKESDYASGWDTFEEVIVEAARIMKSVNASQNEINTSQSNLMSAIGNLVKYDLRDENELVKVIKTGLEFIYSGVAGAAESELKEGYTDKLVDAIQILGDKKQDQEKVNQGVGTLSSAIDKLDSGSGAEDGAITDTINKIAAIGEVSYSEESKNKIDEARSAYDALTNEAKEQVTNYNDLVTAESAYLNAKLVALEQEAEEAKLAAEEAERLKEEAEEAKRLAEEEAEKAKLAAKEAEEQASENEAKAAAAQAAQKEAEEKAAAAEQARVEAEEKAAAAEKARKEAEEKIAAANEAKESAETELAKITFSTKSVKLKAVKSTKSKQSKVTWKKVSGADGYVIQYSTSSKFKKAKTVTIKKGSTTSQTVKKLTSGKKYYFRIRAYKMINGENVYTSYTSSKNVKIK